jgi:hypothetical protein
MACLLVVELLEDDPETCAARIVHFGGGRFGIAAGDLIG